MRIFTYIFLDVTSYPMEIFCQKKFAVRLIYDTTKNKVSLFYFKKFSKNFKEILNYFAFLTPPLTGLVSQIFFSVLSLPAYLEKVYPMNIEKNSIMIKLILEKT